MVTADAHQPPPPHGLLNLPKLTKPTESTNPKDLIGLTKPPMHLVPASAVIVEAMAFKDGARKYGPFNWRGKAVSASVYVAAAKRHLDRWFDGEEIDPDSGVPHLGHARACLAILIDAASVGNMVDDRPPLGKASELIAQYTEKKAVSNTTFGEAA